MNNEEIWNNASFVAALVERHEIRLTLESGIVGHTPKSVTTITAWDYSRKNWAVQETGYMEVVLRNEITYDYIRLDTSIEAVIAELASRRFVHEIDTPYTAFAKLKWKTQAWTPSLPIMMYALPSETGPYIVRKMDAFAYELCHYDGTTIAVGNISKINTGLFGLTDEGV